MQFWKRKNIRGGLKMLSKVKKFHENIMEILYTQNIKKHHNASIELFSLFPEYLKSKEKLKNKTLFWELGKRLKDFGCRNNSVRKEILKAFYSFLAGENYITPFVQYQKAIVDCERFKNMEFLKPNFVDALKETVKEEYAEFDFICY